MSVPGTSNTRPLTLTEELEKLEQSITLTLQGPTMQYHKFDKQAIADLVIEIDSNFSRAHRIVTTNILPLVEQYGEHSKSVWESTKVGYLFSASPQLPTNNHCDLSSGNNSSRPPPMLRFRDMKSLPMATKPQS